MRRYLREHLAEAVLVGALGIVGVVLLVAVLGALTRNSTATIGNTGFADIRYVHDDAHGVGCWIVASDAIACLPDQAFRP